MTMAFHGSSLFERGCLPSPGQKDSSKRGSVDIKVVKVCWGESGLKEFTVVRAGLKFEVLC